MRCAIPAILLASSSIAFAIPLIPRAADPVAQLTAIMPSAASCSGAQNPSECATAAQAVGPLIASFARYGVTRGSEQAMLLSLIAFESAELKFNQNRPGQGTRNMMMPNYVQEYAESIPELKGQVAGKDPAGILALVQPDQYSFGSAAWYYSTKCSADQKAKVQSGSAAGLAAYLECLGTTADDKRTAYWKAACKALNVPTS
jgi:hypothetical protein